MSLEHDPQRQRGRRRRALPKKLADRVSEFCSRTGWSRATAFRLMARCELKFVQPGGAGFPRLIPHSEYQRLGFDDPA
jgi:hypothetical protein